MLIIKLLGLKLRNMFSIFVLNMVKVTVNEAGITVKGHLVTW